MRFEERLNIRSKVGEAHDRRPSRKSVPVHSPLYNSFNIAMILRLSTLWIIVSQYLGLQLFYVCDTKEYQLN
jgi:hypothetical protein